MLKLLLAQQWVDCLSGEVLTFTNLSFAESCEGDHVAFDVAAHPRLWFPEIFTASHIPPAACFPVAELLSFIHLLSLAMRAGDPQTPGAICRESVCWCTCRSLRCRPLSGHNSSVLCRAGLSVGADVNSALRGMGTLLRVFLYPCCTRTC